MVRPGDQKSSSKAGVEMLGHVEGRRGHRSWKQSHSLEPLRTTLTLCFENSSGQQRVRGFADLRGKSQTSQTQPFPLSARSSGFTPGEWPPGVARQWLAPMPGPTETAGVGGLFLPRGWPKVWPPNLCLDFSLPIIWSSSDTGRERRVQLRREIGELSGKERESEAERGSCFYLKCSDMLK